MFLFQFYFRYYSSFAADGCYMYLSFSIFYFINVYCKFVICLCMNKKIYKIKKVKKRIDSCNSLPIEKMLTFHNVIILIKSVVNKNKNGYYDNIYLAKGSYEDKSKT